MRTTLFPATILLLLALGGGPAHAAPAVPLTPTTERARTHADWHAPLAGELRARAYRAPARKQRVKERRLIGTGEVVGAGGSLSR